MNTATYNAFCAHAASQPDEVCGLVVDVDGVESYRPCRNLTPGTGHFSLHPQDWAEAEDTSTILAVCHSHLGSCLPSAQDREECEEVGFPYFILGQDGLWRLDPQAHVQNLVNRPFRFGWNDCYSLVRDYFGQDMHDYPRDPEDAGALYFTHIPREGWMDSSAHDLRTGDVLMLKSRAALLPDHAAIYVAPGRILHHRTNHLSQEEPLTFSILQRVSRVIRRLR